MGEGIVTVGDIAIGQGRPLALIAGPCVIESRDAVLALAESLRELAASRSIPFIFKASFDKANRTSIDSYRGPGPDEGLRILSEVREAVGVPVLSDIHEPGQAAAAAEALDVLQIPAFLCRQTDLIAAAAGTGRPLNIKKGQFMAPADMRNVLDKARHAGNDQVMLTERGASFGYNTLVVDMRSIPIMQSLGAPVVFDATHSTQQPGGLGAQSGGEREMALPLARAAVAVGCDALFFEVHEDPEKALSDAATMIPLAWMPEILDTLLRIRAALADG